MSDFVDTCVPDCFNKNGAIPEGSKGIYDHDEAAPFSGYTRTSSPNAVKEKFYEGTIVTPSGESDQF
jgi:hypothetical protein